MASEDTKTALLEAAKRLILERGYAGVTVRELAAASGANVAAVNYHFGSRENLLNQAMLDVFVQWMEISSEVEVDSDAEPLRQLAARARPMVDGIPAAQPAFIMVLEVLLRTRHSPELHRQVAEHYVEMRRFIADSMAQTKRGSRLPRRYLDVAASYMIAVVDGLQIQALLDPNAIPTGDELAAFYEGLAAAARAAGQSDSGAVDSP